MYEAEMTVETLVEAEQPVAVKEDGEQSEAAETPVKPVLIKEEKFYLGLDGNAYPSSSFKTVREGDKIDGEEGWMSPGTVEGFIP